MTAAGPRVRAVWTDFGGVLTPPVEETALAYCRRIGVAPDRLRHAIGVVAARYGAADPMEPLDTPLVSQDEWTAQVEEVLAAGPGPAVRLGDFAAAWFRDRPVNREWLAYLRALRRGGVFVGLLSNMVPAWDAHRRRMVDDDEFDGVLLSFQVGLRKPSREIFELAARISGAAMDECVLVDDMARNCAGAAAVGWRAVEFSESATARSSLSTWPGIPPGDLTTTGKR